MAQKELQLKYGCNPNQKPSRIFMEEGELPFTFSVYRNGELKAHYPGESYSTAYNVNESGEYYYHI